ncbi:hypothetical protein BT96DRAFT_957291 [Gymnopus androsaceus JB14]|uniref:Regulator of volume decrease after cellular swelling-domain-containing protein n=1 Tax=Gymnopus androsaceus JB14 TaxID=1447944 RepID=A0A6A4HNP6_9AGAR|nr:hypothetical protein BT96DRAFT_957291 [Gymnopus androsaceus JB14]
MAAATLISSIPNFVSPEEHKTIVGSTPSSFSDIPPVLRHKEESVSVTLEPSLEGFSEEDGKEGTLYVLESALIYMSKAGKGFQIEYPSITLHAVSRGDTHPSIYCQLDERRGSREDDMDMRELSIVPTRVEALEPIFEALSLCAALHPDPPGSDDEDDFDEALIDAPDGSFEVFTGTEDEELSAVGRVRGDFINDNRYTPY